MYNLSHFKGDLTHCTEAFSYYGTRLRPPYYKPFNNRFFIIIEMDANFFYINYLDWAKVARHPWWPCCIAIDPRTMTSFKKFKKIKPLFLLNFLVIKQNLVG